VILRKHAGEAAGTGRKSLSVARFFAWGIWQETVLSKALNGRSVLTKKTSFDTVALAAGVAAGDFSRGCRFGAD